MSSNSKKDQGSKTANSKKNQPTKASKDYTTYNIFCIDNGYYSGFNNI